MPGTFYFCFWQNKIAIKISCRARSVRQAVSSACTTAQRHRHCDLQRGAAHPLRLYLRRVLHHKEDTDAAAHHEAVRLQKVL